MWLNAAVVCSWKIIWWSTVIHIYLIQKQCVLCLHVCPVISSLSDVTWCGTVSWRPCTQSCWLMSMYLLATVNMVSSELCWINGFFHGTVLTRCSCTVYVCVSEREGKRKWVYDGMGVDSCLTCNLRSREHEERACDEQLCVCLSEKGKLCVFLSAAHVPFLLISLGSSLQYFFLLSGYSCAPLSIWEEAENGV